MHQLRYQTIQKKIKRESKENMKNRSDRKKLEAIFFDFDGVLVDSTTIKEEGFTTLFSHLPKAAL